MFKRIAVMMIRFYQLSISPFMGGCCRFYPSCSHYALIAYEKRGFVEATILVIKRLLRCGPWHDGGVDFLATENNKNN
ncbi:MAG: membrane protein insertion efficiency factor YidD [Pseudomonadota bacterium]